MGERVWGAGDGGGAAMGGEWGARGTVGGAWVESEGGEGYKVPHFDAKGLADALFTKHGVPTTNLYTAFYFDNLVHFGMGPKPDGDGGYALTFPMPADDLLPCIAA